MKYASSVTALRCLRVILNRVVNSAVTLVFANGRSSKVFVEWSYENNERQ